jgi:hypothetical protein
MPPLWPCRSPRLFHLPKLPPRLTPGQHQHLEPNAPSQGAPPLPADAPLLAPVAELLTYEKICTTPAKTCHKHLNNHIMSRLSSAFADTLRACNAEPESNAVHQQMLMFFKCILWAPAGKLPSGANVVSIVRRRLDRWKEGQKLQLWIEAQDGAAARAAARGASNHTPAPVEQSYRAVQEGIERRAVSYARDGDVGHVVKAFLPERKAVASASTLESYSRITQPRPFPSCHRPATTTILHTCSHPKRCRRQFQSLTVDLRTAARV